MKNIGTDKKARCGMNKAKKTTLTIYRTLGAKIFIEAVVDFYELTVSITEEETALGDSVIKVIGSIKDIALIKMELVESSAYADLIF